MIIDVEVSRHNFFLDTWPACTDQVIIPDSSEILRISGMLPNQGFNDFDRLRHRSPSPMASSNLVPNMPRTAIGGWNGLPQEVINFQVHSKLICYEMFDYRLLNLYNLLQPKGRALTKILC